MIKYVLFAIKTSEVLKISEVSESNFITERVYDIVISIGGRNLLMK